MHQTMTWNRLPSGLILTLHGRHNPDDEEWKQYVQFAEQFAKKPGTRVLVLSLGGAPSVTQRRRLVATFADQPAATAIVTSSALMRTVGVAIGWFNKSLRVFGAHDLELAFDFLGIASDQREEIRGELRRLGHRLGLDRVA